MSGEVYLVEDMGGKLVVSVASTVVAESSVTLVPVDRHSQHGSSVCLIAWLLSPAPPALGRWQCLLLLISVCLFLTFDFFVFL